MILGWPYPKRLKLVEELLAKPNSKTQGLRFQGQLQYFPIHRVSIDFPKYRLKNGRTAAAQIEYLAIHPEVDRDIFTKDPELEKAQEIQHGLLKGMVNEEGLYNYFK